MTDDRKQRQRAAIQLAESNELTAGMYVHTRGGDLILGRHETVGSDGRNEADDRVKLVHLGSDNYGLSVKRHTGRWQKTPFSGPLDEMFQTIWTLMQHLVASYP